MAMSLQAQNPPNIPETPEHSDRVANYALNRDTLLKNIVKDAQSDKPDIKSEINNSGGNVNLQCNSGFFLAVAKPAFSLFHAGFSKTINGITMTMPNPPIFTKDSSELHQTMLYQFEISTR